MRRHASLGLIVALLSGPFVAMSASAADCQLCQPKAQPPAEAAERRPLRIEIDSVLDFSSIAIRHPGSGAVEIDSHTGARRVSGGLIGLGGPALRGTVRMTGEPFARVRVSLPAALELRALGGATATISDIETTLSADPMIGANGELLFSFGGRMTVHSGESGEFQGRFPISAEYQ
jgi:Domain of unknown function (DUF4402)